MGILRNVRGRTLIAALVSCVGFLAVGSSGASAATTTLAGEILTTAPLIDFALVNGNCNAFGSWSFGFGASGFATGPVPGKSPLTSYPGGFHESGTFTLASPTGPLTSFSSNFSIYPLDGSPTVTGTKGLVGTGTGSCMPNTPGFPVTNLSVSATVSYSVTSPFVETGTAPLTITEVRGNVTFTEGPFLPTPPPLLLGCNTDGQSNGNDQCLQ
jgi:hypothetical protein